MKARIQCTMIFKQRCVAMEFKPSPKLVFDDALSRPH